MFKLIKLLLNFSKKKFSYNFKNKLTNLEIEKFYLNQKLFFLTVFYRTTKIPFVKIPLPEISLRKIHTRKILPLEIPTPKNSIRLKNKRNVK